MKVFRLGTYFLLISMFSIQLNAMLRQSSGNIGGVGKQNEGSNVDDMGQVSSLDGSLSSSGDSTGGPLGQQKEVSPAILPRLQIPAHMTYDVKSVERGMTNVEILPAKSFEPKSFERAQVLDHLWRSSNDPKVRKIGGVSESPDSKSWFLSDKEKKRIGKDEDMRRKIEVYKPEELYKRYFDLYDNILKVQSEQGQELLKREYNLILEHLEKNPLREVEFNNIAYQNLYAKFEGQRALEDQKRAWVEYGAQMVDGARESLNQASDNFDKIKKQYDALPEDDQKKEQLGNELDRAQLDKNGAAIFYVGAVNSLRKRSEDLQGVEKAKEEVLKAVNDQIEFIGILVKKFNNDYASVILEKGKDSNEAKIKEIELKSNTIALASQLIRYENEKKQIEEQGFITLGMPGDEARREQGAKVYQEGLGLIPPA